MLAEVAVDKGLPSVDDLFSRVTFAYDLDEGRRIVSGADFDLYVLDADFPDALLMDRRAYIEAFMRDTKSDVARWEEFVTEYEHQGHVVYDNFVPFYQRCLDGRHGKIIVYSSSMVAIHTARRLDLPFYSKGTPPDNVRWWLAHSARMSGSGLTADGWEHGGKDELIERYILP